MSLFARVGEPRVASEQRASLGFGGASCTRDVHANAVQHNTHVRRGATSVECACHSNCWWLCVLVHVYASAGVVLWVCDSNNERVHVVVVVVGCVGRLLWRGVHKLALAGKLLPLVKRAVCRQVCQKNKYIPASESVRRDMRNGRIEWKIVQVLSKM